MRTVRRSVPRALALALIIPAAATLLSGCNQTVGGPAPSAERDPVRGVPIARAPRDADPLAVFDRIRSDD